MKSFDCTMIYSEFLTGTKVHLDRVADYLDAVGVGVDGGCDGFSRPDRSNVDLDTTITLRGKCQEVINR